MLWMIGMFLQGSIPHVNMTGIRLDQDRYERFVVEIADFVTSDRVLKEDFKSQQDDNRKSNFWYRQIDQLKVQDTILQEFIDFDASAFFRTIVKLFHGQAWDFLR